MSTEPVRTGRILPSYDLAREIEETNKQHAIEAAANTYLSRLFDVDPDMPVRFDPPVNYPPASSTVINPGPAYFYSGNGKSKSRTIYAGHAVKRFGRR